MQVNHFYQKNIIEKQKEKVKLELKQPYFELEENNIIDDYENIPTKLEVAKKLKINRLKTEEIKEDVEKLNQKKDQTIQQGDSKGGTSLLKKMVSRAITVNQLNPQTTQATQRRAQRTRGLRKQESSTQFQLKAKVGQQNQYLEKFEIFEWDFNPLMYNQGSSSTVFSFVFNIYQKFNFFEFTSLQDQSDRQILESFCESIQQGYLPNPFHNYLHAIDVTNSTAFFILKYYRKILTELDQFTLLMSSLIHDLGHPGVQNNFLIALQHKYAIKYNDQNVLENLHLSKFFKILSHPEFNILKNMNQSSYRYFRKVCIHLVLKTDIAQLHENQLGIKKVLDQKKIDYEVEENRIALMSQILNTSDISHGAKDTHLHKIWVKLVQNEFQKQAYLEGKYDLPLNKFSNKNNIPKLNSRFLKVILKSNFQCLEQFYQKISDEQRVYKNQDFTQCYNNININIEYWDQQMMMDQTQENSFAKEMNIEEENPLNSPKDQQSSVSQDQETIVSSDINKEIPNNLVLTEEINKIMKKSSIQGDIPEIIFEASNAHEEEIENKSQEQ